MFFQLIKTKILWVIWLTISLLGMLYALYSINSDKIARENGFKCNVALFGNFESVFVTENETFFATYVDFFENHDKYEYLPFPLKAIGYSQDIIILDTLMQGKLYEITYYREDPTVKGKYSWEKSFIY